MTEYLEVVQTVLGPSSDSPGGLVHRWGEFIEECEEGYDWTLYEYDDEIGVRGDLQLLVDCEELSNLPEHARFLEQLMTRDQCFRGLLQETVKRPGVSEWWRAGVLKFAGEEYCADLQRNYGISAALNTSAALKTSTTSQ